MISRVFGAAGRIAFLFAALGASQARAADPLEAAKSRIAPALDNALSLERLDQIGLATVWDGNKYVQCRRMADRVVRCEAGGALMQPSLGHILTLERIARLTALDWRLDPSFGNYVRNFAAGSSAGQIADAILQALAEGYDADLSRLETRTDWVASELCPPRNGPTQNLAGSISDARAMRATALYACAYTPLPDSAPRPATGSVAELTDIYGARIAGELQRLRVNAEREVFLVLSGEIGYIQCAPETDPPALYCEAQSADSWPALASVLTPDRVARLHEAGYADPGRAPNYSKTYRGEAADDAGVARELLTLLHDVYGYAGASKLELATEKGKAN